MTEAPQPFVPLEVDLRGLPWMPLNLLRLFDSDLFALTSGDEFKAAVTLWGKSWYQIPAGSLPDDDRVLAYLAGAGSRWAKWKPVVMRGWVLCSDGRLYHKVVAEAALKAWKERVRHKGRRQRDQERLDKWRAEQRARGMLGKNGGLRGTETPDETELKRVSVDVSDATRNAQETARESDSDSDSDKKPVLEKKARKRAASNETTIPPDFAISPRVEAWAIGNHHTRLAERLESFIGYVKSKAKTYADWDEAFMRAVREDWAKLNGAGNGSAATRKLSLAEQSEQGMRLVGGFGVES